MSFISQIDHSSYIVLTPDEQKSIKGGCCDPPPDPPNGGDEKKPNVNGG